MFNRAGEPSSNRTEHQYYVNQMSSFKQASPVQFGPTGNGAPLHDAQMFSNIQMMQQSGSGAYLGFPNNSVLSQSHNMGLSMPQLAASFDKNLNIYSANRLTKNNNSPLGMSPMHPSSFMSQRGNFSSDQISTPDGSFLPNQVFQEKNLFGQVPAQSLNNDLLSVNYTQQGVTVQRNNTSDLEPEERREDSGQHGISPRRPSATLDPLEQKILFNTDDNCWESSFGGSSWSALMQSAVGETSSSDTAIQEEWRELSFQNHEPSTDNQPSNFISNSEKQQNNWVDRNLQNVSSPSSEPPEQFLQKSNVKYNFPGFQQSGQQYVEQKHRQLVPASLPSSNPWPAQYNENFKIDAGQPNLRYSGHELRGPSWLHGSASNSASGIQKPFDQVNELNIQSYSVKSEKLAPGENVESMPAHLGASSDLHGQNVTFRSKNVFELPNKDDISNNQTPGMRMNSKISSLKQLPLTGTSVAQQGFGFRGEPTDARTRQTFSFFPSMSMGNPNATSLSSHYVNDYIKNQNLAPPGPSQMTNKLPAYSAASPQDSFQPSPWPNITSQQDLPSPKPLLGASSDLHGQNETSQSKSMFELLNKDDISNNQTPGMRMNSRVSSPNQLSLTRTNFQPSPWPNITAQQDVSSSKPLSGASSDLHGQNVTSQSKSMFELLNKDDISDNQTPGMRMNSKVSSPKQLPLNGTSVAQQGFGFRKGAADAGTQQTFSFFPSLSMGNPNATSLSSKYVNDYITNQHLAPPAPNQMTNKFPAHSAASSQVNFQPSPWPNITTQPVASSPKHVSSNLFQSPDSDCSSLETNPGGPNEHPNQNSFKHEQEFGTFSGKSGYHEQQLEKESSPHESSTQIYNPTSLSRTTHTQSLNQNFSLLQQLHSSRNVDTDSGKRLPLKCDDNVNCQQAIANAKEMLSGQKSVVKDESNSDLSAFSSMDNKGLYVSNDDQSGKASSAAYLQNLQQIEHQNQPQISMQMAPSNGTLTDDQVLPMYNPKAAVNAADPISGLSIANLQENSLIRQQSKHLSPPTVLPSDAMCQCLAVPKLKKRKIVEFKMVPWHKEVNQEKFGLQNISMAELKWAEASNRVPEEAKNDGENIDDVVPTVRAKRRLTFTTQLMQQVLRPAPDVILFADDVAYYAARSALRDACSLTSKMGSDTNNVSSDKPKTSKRTSFDFSKVVEGLISRVKKLEGNLSRLDKRSSIVDIKVENQDLEKFSTINRYAKFHIRVHPVGPASFSSQSSVPKMAPQRYVVGHPMPNTLPEVIDCLSL